jgi:hypothetical protein
MEAIDSAMSHEQMAAGFRPEAPLLERRGGWPGEGAAG